MSDWHWDRLAPIYVTELYRQARTCRSACDRVLELGEALRTGRQPPPAELAELQQRAEQAISCAASMRNLLFGSNARKKSPAEVYELGTKRIDWLGENVGEHKAPTIRSVDARNSLEHFDERMDALAHEWLHESDDHRKRPIAFDTVQKSRVLWEGRPYIYVRCYIADEANFVILDHDVHIPSLRGEAQRLEKAISRRLTHHPGMWDTTGAAPMMVVLPGTAGNSPHSGDDDHR